LVRREAQEEIHVEITTNDFDESQQRSLADLSSSRADDDTFEILEAEGKPQDLDFELVSRPATGADGDLVSIASSQFPAGPNRSLVDLVFKRPAEEASADALLILPLQIEADQQVRF
jgi:hypothetical protein